MKNYYVISLLDANGVMQSYGVTATSGGNAILAAKTKAAIANPDSSMTDIQTFQVMGRVDAEGQ